MRQQKPIELGYFGNIWVKQNILKYEGDMGPDHKHFFDHVTLLTKGSVEVHVEGKEPKKFVAPTFIVIRKEQSHRIVALEDDVNYYCIFALRNIDGEVIEDIYGEQHDPNSAQTAPEDYWDKVKKIQDI
jgi:hypothetical protein